MAIGLLSTYSALASDPAPAKAPDAAGGNAGLTLTVLGSGGPAALGRAASSYAIALDGTPRILVDAGPGSFTRIGERHLSLDALDIVLLTHLHADHAGELPGLVKSRAVSAGETITFRIFGPVGHAASATSPEFPSTRRFVDLLFGTHGAFAYLPDFSSPVRFVVVDLPKRGAAPTRPAQILRQGDLSIQAVRGHHGDAPAVIYRVDYRGHAVVFSGDIDAQGLPALGAIAKNADLLVFDAVVLDPPDSPSILYTLHTPPAAIGRVAAQAGVRELMLSHLSPAVDGDRTDVTASIAANFHGRLTWAEDGLTREF